MLVGNLGPDRLFGAAGNDYFFTKDRVVDIVSGGPGSDWGYFDPLDRITSVETAHR